MMVRPKKAPPARKMRGGQPTPKVQATPDHVPAPIAGWVLNESLSRPMPGGARILDNWICGLESIRPRKGFSKHATIASDQVHSLFTYKSGSTEKFFAASDDSIFEITSPASPTVIPAADVSGLTSGDWHVQQFGTAGGDYLLAVNGSDAARLYDGSTWSATTISGVTTSDLSYVWSYANRLFFVEENTMSAHYLPVDSIGGAASTFSLAGVFKKGGALWFGATYSTDSGDGIDDRCAFFSTEGEVAIYVGTNPGSAADWSKQGVYEVSPPLGPRAIMRAGGDLMVATEVGLIALSEVVMRDVGALSEGAASKKIEKHWQERVGTLGGGWAIKKWPSENIMVVSQPGGDACLVANLHSGAWSRFTGMDSRALGYFGGNVYFGDANGAVFAMQSGGLDGAAPYTARYLGQFEPFGAPGRQKTVLQARPVFRSNTPISPQVGMLADYDETLPAVPNAAAFDPTDGWDYSTWDTSTWDAPASSGVGADDSQWVAVGVTGYAHAPFVQLTFGSTVGPDVEYIGKDLTLRAGAMVA